MGWGGKASSLHGAQLVPLRSAGVCRVGTGQRWSPGLGWGGQPCPSVPRTARGVTLPWARCHPGISHRHCTLPASVSPLVRRRWHGVTGSTQTLSMAQPPPAQRYHWPRTSPPHAAGCRGEACHAGKGDALSQPAQPAPAGSSTRWHNLPPQHGGGSRDVAAMAEQSCFPPQARRQIH